MAYFDSDKLDELEHIVDEAENPLTTKEVVEQSSTSRPTALRYLKHLQKQGRIKKKGTGTTLEWYTGDYIEKGDRE